jgi:hypothetical protein
MIQVLPIAVTAVGAGIVFRMMRHMPTTSLANNSVLLRTHCNLLRILQQFERLQQPDDLEFLVKTIDACLIMGKDAEAGRPVMPIHVNRLINSIMDRANNMIEAAKRSDDSTVTVACIQCIDEELDALDTILEAILHNIMLDVAP